MPIDIDRVVGARLSGPGYTWDEREVILYHLGIGAGGDPVDPGELRYVYEGDLQVLPTFGTIPPFMTMMSLITVEGVDVNPAMILHGGHELTVHRRIPTSGVVINDGVVSAIYDRGKGALVELEISTRLEDGGDLLFTNRPTIYIRGEGGFGGEPGSGDHRETPSRPPDHVIESPTLPQQALLYRMASGDRNPLHVDPGFARVAGYDRPILHGLCSYGIVAKAVLDCALGADPTSMTSYRARFSGVVLPGETVVIRIWDEGDLVVSADTKERMSPVITNGVLTRS